MLVQASNYYIAFGGKIAEYITAGKKVIYSMHGDEPKIKPKANYFPSTKHFLDMSSGLNIATNYLRCLPYAYGFETGGMNITKIDMTSFENRNMKISTPQLNVSYPYGVGFETGNLPIETSTLVDMDSSSSFDFSYINF